MKVTKAMLVYLTSFIVGYLLLSAVGCLFFKSDLTHYTYSECLGTTNWFVIYTLFLGWWTAGIVANDYYESTQ